MNMLYVNAYYVLNVYFFQRSRSALYYKSKTIITLICLGKMKFFPPSSCL